MAQETRMHHTRPRRSYHFLRKTRISKAGVLQILQCLLPKNLMKLCSLESLLSGCLLPWTWHAQARGKERLKDRKWRYDSFPFFSQGACRTRVATETHRVAASGSTSAQILRWPSSGHTTSHKTTGPSVESGQNIPGGSKQLLIIVGSNIIKDQLFVLRTANSSQVALQRCQRPLWTLVGGNFTSWPPWPWWIWSYSLRLPALERTS